MQYVASTLSASVEYAGYVQDGNDLPQLEHRVLVKGGANIANKYFVTPRGVITEVNDEDAKFLEQHELFRLHKKNGYVEILESKPSDPDDVAANMETRDESSPLVDQDYEAAPENVAKPVAAKKGR